MSVDLALRNWGRYEVLWMNGIWRKSVSGLCDYGRRLRQQRRWSLSHSTISKGDCLIHSALVVAEVQHNNNNGPPSEQMNDVYGAWVVNFCALPTPPPPAGSVVSETYEWKLYSPRAGERLWMAAWIYRPGWTVQQQLAGVVGGNGEWRLGISMWNSAESGMNRRRWSFGCRELKSEGANYYF